MENPFAKTMRAFGLPSPPELKTPPTERERAEAALYRQVHGRAPPKALPERSGGVDIFIGGGWDDQDLRGRGYGAMHDYAERYEATGRPTRYFPNAKVDQVMSAVRAAQANGGPVNIIGHSWGGTDAYNVATRAAREGLRIDNLGTVDPVGGNFLLGGVRGREAAGSWTNVNAVPKRRDLNDVIASVGGKPSRVPVRQADHQVRVTASHGDLDVMMDQGGVRRALDESRRGRPLDALDLRDELSTPEWMRRRAFQRPTARTWP